MTKIFKYHTLKYSLLFALGLLTLVFQSCETTEEIDDFPIIKPQIVVNSIIAEDSSWVFQVSKSLSVLDNANTDYLTNATIKLYKDDVLMATIKEKNNQNFYIYNGEKPKMGSNYKIEVSAKPYMDVSSETNLPSKVTVGEIRTFIKDSSTWYDPWMKRSSGNMNGHVSLKINDPAKESNYYLVSFSAVDTYFYVKNPGDTVFDLYESSLNYGIADHPAIEISSYLGYIISDQFFDGQNVEIDFPIEDWSYHKYKSYQVTIKSLNRDAYLYYRSMFLYYDRMGNPFSEPVQVYSNIKNGYGIFGGYSVFMKRFHF